jgi:hypothetical protein
MEGEEGGERRTEISNRTPTSAEEKILKFLS